ncbi:MAG: DUF3800 domain-containing protein [Ignavibacteriaceae bacterium]|nr:DUF3800 domain-containing protein [Ignavibacteriaceae bacterium]
MYFFYVDESGEKNPKVKRDEPFVFLGLGLHEYQWKKFEDTINRKKIKLILDIKEREGIQLDLADAEIRSSDVRIPSNRAQHKFLRYLTEPELSSLIDLFYEQLEIRHFNIFAVVIDKNCLDDFMDIEKLLKKVYELTLERAENFIFNDHPKQNAIFVLDNTSKQLNRSLAMKHSFFQRNRTSSGLRVNHIIEIPFFVESYLSNGVQLADLCAYNVYRAFLDKNSSYPFFRKLLPYFYSGKKTRTEKIDGLKAFPEGHRWGAFIDEIEKERARLLRERALK